ncbi:MAG: GNAT family N-acetyltransferase [Bacillota bacterium]
MIRPLRERDRNILLDFVKNESEINLFIIGDVENDGFDKDFQKLWGEFSKSGELIAVLLKYFDSCIFYSRLEFDIKGFYEIMQKEDFKLLSGEKSIVEKFEKVHNFSKKRDTYLCKLDSKNNLVPLTQKDRLKKVELKDIDRILKLYSLIDEFENVSAESTKKGFAEGNKRAYYIEENGEMVAIAQTTAENSSSAMIVGVCTHPDYRNMGYATSCMTKLCGELLEEGKSLCLFYNNPKAGSIYKRMGFTDIGMWTMYNK